MTRARPLLACTVLLLASHPVHPQQPLPPAVPGGSSGESRASTEQRSGAGRLTPAQQTLKTFRTVYAYSDTVYLGSDDLSNALMKRFDVHAWKLALGKKDSADVWLKVTRPAFTFDWRYVLTDRASGKELAAGRIVAWDGKRAADAIAADVARVIGRVRAFPLHVLAALSAADPKSRQWEMTYHDGSEGPRNGARLTVSVSPERIVGRRQGRVLFVIPARSVSGIGYNPLRSEPAKGWDSFWTAAFGSVSDSNPNAALGAIALLPVALGGELLLNQFKRTEHFCDLAWVDNGTFRNVILRAADEERVQEFLAAVAEVSQHKSVDMESEAAILRQAIERATRDNNFVSLRLDRRATVGWKRLSPGDYRVVVVERDPRYAIAYFLAPDVTAGLSINAIAAQIPVRIEQRVSMVLQSQVVYGEDNGITSIKEIVLPEKTFSFSAVPLEFATEPQISEPMEQLLADAAIKPKYHSVHVRSDTVYLKREVMEQSLAQHPALIEWEIKVAPRPEEADLTLVVKRPFLTFDWVYVVSEANSGKNLLEGKITARDGGRAATLIADELVNALRAKAAQERTQERTNEDKE